MHLQIGWWLNVWQSVFCPHLPGQGSTHFWFIQARLLAHSELMVHSGLHPGGVPMYEGRQEQIAWPLLSLHKLFGPQGVGTHG